jgi:hypothetical protein
MSIQTARKSIHGLRLQFAFIGSAIAWTLHLMLAYAFAEWACVGGEPRFEAWGVSGTAWVLFALSLPLFLLSAASTYSAFRITREVRADLEKAKADLSGSLLHLAYAGLLLGISFTFIILVQVIPVFYFLGGCQ